RPAGTARSCAPAVMENRSAPWLSSRPPRGKSRQARARKARRAPCSWLLFLPILGLLERQRCAPGLPLFAGVFGIEAGVSSARHGQRLCVQRARGHEWARRDGLLHVKAVPYSLRQSTRTEPTCGDDNQSSREDSMPTARFPLLALIAALSLWAKPLPAAD